METVKYNKRTSVKFETSKEFLTANKSLVLKILKSEFIFKEFDLKTLAVDYFSYIQNSDYTRRFTFVYAKKDLVKAVGYSVKNFKEQYKTLREDSAAKNDFDEERKRAGFATKSF